jgi:hypothetical protein
MAVLAILGMVCPWEVGSLVAYNCANATNQVDVYSLLEPVACPSATPHNAMESIIFGEIMQIKSEYRVPVCRCKVIETVTSQYCRFLSANGPK